MMEQSNYNFRIIIDGHLTRIPNGLKVVKSNTSYFLWIWHKHIIDIIEQPLLPIREASSHNIDVNATQPQSNNVKLKGNVVDILLFGGDSVYALDSQGFVYSFSHMENKSISPVLSMDVDLFSSSPTSDISSKWKENEVTRLINCEEVISICYLSKGLAILTVEEECTAIQIYSLPEFNFKSIVHLERNCYEDAVLSCCNIRSLSPSLKKYFQDKIEIFDTEIVLVGLPSGVVLWNCVSSSSVIKGPFFLCSLLHKVQNAHWINDPASNLTTLLLIVLSSGPVVVFGLQTESDSKPTTLYLPDCAKKSWMNGNCLISSNYIDCFISELKFGGNVTLSSSSLPIKGITAMTKAPDMEDMIVTTMHSVYVIGLGAMSSEDSSPQFIIPEQILLDNLFIQTQMLDDVYNQMHKEDEVLKAISTSIVAQNTPNLFRVAVRIISDTEFRVAINITEANLSFSCKFWNVNTEICYEDNHKESVSTVMTEDFNSGHDLKITLSCELAIGSTIVIELVSFLNSGQPILIIPVGKVQVDACHFMVSKLFAPAIMKKEETLENILQNWNIEPFKESDHECRLVLKIPNFIPIASCLQMILEDSQERIVVDDWNKISEFKKHNAHVKIKNIPVSLNLNVECKELVIICPDVEMCHKVKQAVSKRFDQDTEGNKCIPEGLALEIQAAYQSLEIEILNDVKEFLIVQEIKNKLRTTISSKVDSL